MGLLGRISLAAVRRTLPYSHYTDPSILALERDRVLSRAWQYAGNVAELPAPGHVAPVELNGVPLLLTRSGDGEIRALVNVCSHRGSILADTPRMTEFITCPYHSWRYDLTGALLSAPRSAREPDFDPSDHALEPVPVGTWGPFIFVATDPQAPPLSEVLADLPEIVASNGIEVDELVFHGRVTSELRANWKICVENFLECYHCRIAHPGFSRAIDTSADGYELATAPTFSTQRGPVRANPVANFDPYGEIRRSQFHLLLPNTVINIMPGRPNLSIGPILPTSPTSTRRFLDYFFGPEVPPDWMAGMLEFDDQVGREDAVLVESLQKGVAARPDRRGTLFMDSERLIAHFNDHVLAAID